MSLLRPEVDHLITEADAPLVNRFSAKQQRLLVEPLYSSWGRDRTDFLADANIGVYSSVRVDPLVPDALLSLDVSVPDGWWGTEERCYCLWDYGKPPDVVVEIVSNRQAAKKTESGKLMPAWASPTMRFLTRRNC